MVDVFSFFQRNTKKSNRIAGPQLPELVDISADDLGDFWVTPNGLAVNSQNDALPIARDLDSARADRFGEQLARRESQRPALQTQTYAIAGRTHVILLPQEVV